MTLDGLLWVILMGYYGSFTDNRDGLKETVPGSKYCRKENISTVPRSRGSRSRSLQALRWERLIEPHSVSRNFVLQEGNVAAKWLEKKMFKKVKFRGVESRKTEACLMNVFKS